MRLSKTDQLRIKQLVKELMGDSATVLLFGSRLDDEARGGDIDLLVKTDQTVERPALISAQLMAKLSRALQGRKVDVIISAPNLTKLPIHVVASEQGALL